MSHPLDDAYLRLSRAQEHFDELKREVDDFIKAEYQPTVDLLQANPHAVAPFVLPIRTDAQPIPPRFSLLIGDTIQSLRMALDYLVYQLAILDSGSEQDGTQFPIESSENSFRRRYDERRSAGVYLRGLNATHIAAIELLQPYKGTEWTRILQTLSNVDKHRRLTGNIHNTHMRIQGAQDRANLPFTGAKGLVITMTLNWPDWPSVYVQVHATFSILFDELKLPVIETLEELKTQVAQTLADFQPEFEGIL